MPGILVGADGSDYSQHALEWGAKEAAIRHTSLTVLTVHQAVHGWAGTLYFQDDVAQTQKVAEAARAETDKVLAGLGDSRPESVTVRAVHGYPAEELINAGADADMIVLGSRGSGGWARSLLGSVSSQVVQHATAPVVIMPLEQRSH
jgi:nucleotide-binding universal stress UspA family protein